MALTSCLHPLRARFEKKNANECRGPNKKDVREACGGIDNTPKTVGAVSACRRDFLRPGIQVLQKVNFDLAKISFAFLHL